MSADEHKGKNLDEIEIDMNQNLMDNNSDESEHEDAIEDIIAIEPLDITETQSEPQSSQHEEKNKIKKSRVLVPWTDEQKMCR